MGLTLPSAVGLRSTSSGWSIPRCPGDVLGQHHNDIVQAIYTTDTVLPCPLFFNGVEAFCSIRESSIRRVIGLPPKPRFRTLEDSFSTRSYDCVALDFFHQPGAMQAYLAI